MEQTKTCSTCGQVKPLSEFNKCRRNKDGLQKQCRQCFSEYNKKRYASQREETKERVRKYREGNLENVFETRMKMCEKNPSTKNANMAVSLAVELGRLDKPDCCWGCGRSASETRISAHHHDYTKPLEVVWVCAKCHRQLDANRREREGKRRFRKSRGVILVYGGHEVCSFDSVADAARAVGRRPHSISQCLSGKSKTCAGYGWRYEGVSDE